jgi:outer membrane murein-binding lipoprotein Lpp
MSTEKVDSNLFHIARKRDSGSGRDHTGNGKPPGGDDLEARVAKLEAHVEYIRRDLDDLRVDLREFRGETKASFAGVRSEMKSDFRLVFGALIAASLGLAGLMAKGFGWL